VLPSHIQREEVHSRALTGVVADYLPQQPKDFGCFSTHPGQNRISVHFLLELLISRVDGVLVEREWSVKQIWITTKRSPMRGPLACIGLLFFTLLAPGDGLAQRAVSSALASAIEDGIVDPDVADALAGGEAVQLIVNLVPGAEPRKLQRGRLRTNLPGVRVVRRFDRGRGLAVVATEAELATLARDPDVLRIGLDQRVSIQLSQAVPMVNLDVLNNQGYTGTGRLVAIIDTGVDIDHPDLIDAIVDEACFCLGDSPGGIGCCPNGLETQTGPGAGNDANGHGTRVAAIVANAGIVATHPGGAPDTGILAIRVFGASGGGWASDVGAAMDWVATEWPEADVVNLSLGGGYYKGNCDDADAATTLYTTEIRALWRRNTLTVAGTGNTGWGGAMIAPACISQAVSVGAVWDADVGSRSLFGCTDEITYPDLVTCWSNSSATTDVFAPGGLTTASSSGGGENTASGTSYSTPIVSACAAVLREAYPSARIDQLERALKTSPKLVVDTTSGRSFPRLDCDASLEAMSEMLPTFQGEGRLWLAAIAFCLFSGVVARARIH
jgi:subtilisin family serine protease